MAILRKWVLKKAPVVHGCPAHPYIGSLTRIQLHMMPIVSVL